MAQAQGVNILRVAPRKYRNEPTVLDEVRYDSKLEARCAAWHDLRVKAGEILWWTRQVPFRLEGGVVYRADFLAALAPSYAAPGGPFVEVIDASGYITPQKRNKLKQMLARHRINVQLYRASGSVVFFAAAG